MCKLPIESERKFFFSDLEEHKMTHASVKPFQCELCPSQCVRKRSLKAHYIRKHGIIKNFSEGAKPKVRYLILWTIMEV